MDADRVQEGHLDLKSNIQTRAESQNWTNWRRHCRSSEFLKLQGAFTPPPPVSLLPREHSTFHRRIVKEENSHWKRSWSRQWEIKEKEHHLHLQKPQSSGGGGTWPVLCWRWSLHAVEHGPSRLTKICFWHENLLKQTEIGFVQLNPWAGTGAVSYLLFLQTVSLTFLFLNI